MSNKPKPEVRFGSLVVLDSHGPDHEGRPRALIICSDCGATGIVTHAELRAGRASCCLPRSPLKPRTRALK